MDIKEFLLNYRQAFGSKASLPLLFGYSDKPIANTEKIGGCFFKGHRCFIGLLDPSVRPWVGKDELSFTIPFCRFCQMMETMKDCFLFDSHAWPARLQPTTGAAEGL